MTDPAAEPQLTTPPYLRAPRRRVIGCIVATLLLAGVLALAYRLSADSIRNMIFDGTSHPENPALLAGQWTAYDPSADATVTLTLSADGLAGDSEGILMHPTLWYAGDVEEQSEYIGSAHTLTGTLFFYDHDSWQTSSCDFRVESAARQDPWDAADPLERTLYLDESNNGSALFYYPLPRQWTSKQ